MNYDEWRESNRRAAELPLISQKDLIRYGLMPWSGDHVVPRTVLYDLAADLQLHRMAVIFHAYALGYRAPERTSVVDELAKELRERFPDGSAPRGTHTSLMDETGLTHATIQNALRAANVRINPHPNGTIESAMRRRWPDGVIPFGQMRNLADEFGSTRINVSQVARRIGWRSARPRRRT